MDKKTELSENQLNTVTGGTGERTDKKAVIGFGCLSCGSCEPYCPAEAISYNPGMEAYTVDTDSCLGCGCCLDTCPKNLIRLI